MKLLIRFFWMLSLASVILFVCLLLLRAMGVLPVDFVSCWFPLTVPLALGCFICLALGLIDLTNATASWARHCDRELRRAARPSRRVRRRRRSRCD